MGNIITGDIKECYKEDTDQLFSLVNKDGTNNNWLKQKGSFRLNIRQNCRRTVRQLDKLPRAVGQSLSLELFKARHPSAETVIE